MNARGKQSFEPKGCFYTRVSGIWQTVWMENVPETYVAGYTVATDIDKGTVTLRFDVRSPRFAKPEVTVEVAGVKATTANGEVTVALPSPVRLWSPDAPNLYDFTAACGADTVRGYFGMRKIETRRDAKGVLRFFLNGEPVFLMGRIAELAAQGLGGAVYTQTTDVEAEVNGLMTYDRKVLKFDPAILRTAHERIYDSLKR